MRNSSKKYLITIERESFIDERQSWDASCRYDTKKKVWSIVVEKDRLCQFIGNQIISPYRFQSVRRTEIERAQTYRLTKDTIRAFETKISWKPITILQSKTITICTVDGQRACGPKEDTLKPETKDQLDKCMDSLKDGKVGGVFNLKDFEDLTEEEENDNDK